MKLKSAHLSFWLLIFSIALPQPAQAIVGYVNMVFTNGYNFVANPLNATNNNDIKAVLGTAPIGAKVYVWNVGNQTFGPPSTFSAGVWDIQYNLHPGIGFVMRLGAAWTNTFVGEVLEGTLTNVVYGSNQFSLLASKVPQTGSLSNLAFPGSDGDNVFLPKTVPLKFSDAYTYFKGHGWFDPLGIVGNQGPVIDVARCFFVQHPGPSTNWIRTFSVQRPSGEWPSGKEPQIRSLSLEGNTVTLSISNPGKEIFDVQFSTDRLEWNTVATNQMSATWTGIHPATPQGYYQLIKP